MRVLFVCSGNICRSPMAAACLRAIVAERGPAEAGVDSAGTLGIEGAPAAPEAIAALAEAGVDLEDHRSQGLTDALVRGADLVVVMDRGHLRTLAARHAGLGGPRFLLRAFEHGESPEPDPPDLEDPIGGPIEDYRRQREIIASCVAHLAAYLRRRS